MKKIFLSSALITNTLLAINCTQIYGDGNLELRLATGSPGELGLVEVLANEFSKDKDAKICWIKAGSGKTLELLKDKKIDIAMVHTPKAEINAVSEGWADNRTLIGSNEFYIIGPKSDLAGIKEAKDVKEAYKKIADSKSLFYTRGDNSGTHKKELSIWKMTNIEPKGEWYQENKDFMLATLKKADKTNGYFMTDSSTYVVAKNELLNSEVLFKGDPYLINTYSALTRNDDGSKNYKLAKEFVEFVASNKGQEIIRNYGKEKYKDALYKDANYAKKYFIEN
ncbi:ABC transporter substrate-binding protein [Campylobacter sp. FMV-PI01]|uniref:ABC transporter substrate-binding protein n=1 Tax=Campylobacter portucalensis TaxID=2608384 RepID=A0A6L5WKR6_9BACT|nr:substrate-binding domain-containing protein [Campylobacter portucalensis]MSN96847.1 ABC transporter substrate-binding protein [Campylobacter portucalensis]